MYRKTSFRYKIFLYGFFDLFDNDWSDDPRDSH